MQLTKARGSAPLYMQIRDLFLARINEGEWSPGEVIPSEIHLAQELEVSQGTVRQAITELVENNVLMRRQGRGTFVAQHDNQRDLFHFFHIADDAGHKVLPDSETLAFKRKRASKDEAQKLGLAAGSSVSVIERIRKLDNRPTLLETITLPSERFPELGKLEVAELPNTLYELYEKAYGVTIHSAQEALRAVAANESDAERLNIEPGTPLLEIERIAIALDGTPIELRVSRCLTDNHHYQNTIF